MTKKITLYFIIVIVLVFVGFAYLHTNKMQSASDTSAFAGPTDYKNAIYTIANQPIELVNGYAEEDAAPGSASKVVTKYFGNEASGDLDGNGTADVAFLITQNSGGSGTFYYAVAALKTPQGYVGTNAVLLGDRIAPQSTQIKDGEVILNYADRKPTDPMTAQPSVGVTKYLKVVNNILVDASN